MDTRQMREAKIPPKPNEAVGIAGEAGQL
jgi:hypothetical protein